MENASKIPLWGMGFVSRKARKGAKTQGFFDTNTNLRKCDFFDTKSHAKAQRRHKGGTKEAQRFI